MPKRLSIHHFARLVVVAVLFAAVGLALGATAPAAANATNGAGKTFPRLQTTFDPPRPTVAPDTPTPVPTTTSSSGSGSSSSSASGPAVPANAQAIGSGGGEALCDRWTLIVPARLVPDGSYVDCGSFLPDAAPDEPYNYQLFRRTVIIKLIAPWGEYYTTLSKPVMVCYRYTNSEVNDAVNMVILNSTLEGPWRRLTTTAVATSPRVCAETSTLRMLFDVGKSRGTTTTTTTSSTTTTTSGRTYTVKKNNNLTGIANLFSVTVASIRRANGLTSDTIYPGQVLIIPDDIFVYTVKKGDYLSAIARRYGITVSLLRSTNRLTGDVIYPGQKLIIPK